jgi:DNA-binding transcriptional MerR regulator
MPEAYKIGDAAALLNLKTYVLRFWETEFPEIAPLRTDSGRRLYSEADLALLERIRFLLHERGLTIGGARKVLAEEKERGVRYVLGPRGALAEQLPPAHHALRFEREPEIQTRTGTAFPGTIPHSVERAHGQADTFPSPSWDEEEEGESEDGGEVYPSYTGAEARTDRAGQFSLPGLEKILPLLPELLQHQGEEAYAQRPYQNPPEPRGMLPLFGAAPLREKAGKPEGRAFFGKKDGRSGKFFLVSLASELEEIARMLRFDSTPPGKTGTP